MTRELAWTRRRSLRAKLEPRNRVSFPDDAPEDADGFVSVSTARYEHDREPEAVTLVLPGGAELALVAAP